ncbi:transcription initiation factor TFIID subunit 9 [Chlorella sorokiniana]|uniref:Transcription initiation factor TFIID subunit 9 n=1 Tax=Chlorella sorokiniana TaxID=3076 RepID=A0A2P6TCL6_CHLSO|nr:transcription initiation factor TFIID subunit 9 [Chlorella sorokiniana]|eukprot:PRW20377.1 transcription initiation factor TFIID subunit 9 [Chlorella sorokiniana]
MIVDLLKTLGIKQYDPRVVDCLLDLTYKAASDILSDAEAINLAAGGNGTSLTPQDIALAAAQHARLQPQPPSMRELHALARRINAQPLLGPSDKQHGIKLPPVADCLLSQNFQVQPRQRPQAPPAAQQKQQQQQQAPRQHYAVKQQPGKIGLAIPQQGWQPPADAAGAAAEPFAPPAHGQQQQQQVGAAGAAGADGMDVEFEDI